jgi:quercetin dioxygenase-like cupin family protein
MTHFIDLKELDIKDALPGATAAYFQTEYLTLAFTELKAGAEIPLHNHMQEAVDIVLEGKLEMQIAQTTDVLMPGMISFIPSNTFHSAKAISDCKVVTVLHPQREL